MNTGTSDTTMGAFGHIHCWHELDSLTESDHTVLVTLICCHCGMRVWNRCWTNGYESGRRNYRLHGPHAPAPAPGPSEVK